jgi:hypothetical protein
VPQLDRANGFEPLGSGFKSRRAASGGAVWSVAYEYILGYRFERNRAFEAIRA